MIEIFLKGGSVMWPLLLTSLVALTAVFERLFFTLRERVRRNPAAVAALLEAAQRGEFDSATAIGGRSRDYVARDRVTGATRSQIIPSSAGETTNKALLW